MRARRDRGNTGRQALLRVLGSVVIAMVMLSACSNDPQAGRGASVQTVATRAARPLAADDFAGVIAEAGRTVINVHVPFEGAIRGTDLFVPYDEIDQRAARLPAARSAPLAVYCRTGRMSAIAAQNLADLGYTDVVELEGGMDAWLASGRSLVMR